MGCQHENVVSMYGSVVCLDCRKTFGSADTINCQHERMSSVCGIITCLDCHVTLVDY